VRKLLRIVVIAVVTFAVIAAGVQWVAPIVFSMWAARKLPKNAGLVPQDLHDLSISEAGGRRFAYFGYEFEVPWNDLDEAQTKLTPKEKPCRVLLSFRSGLRLMVTAVPPKEWANSLPADFKTSPQVIEAVFGHEAMQSDYGFVRRLYEFTPAKMHRWSFSPAVHYREGFVLMVKSVALSPWADSGIFHIQNQSFKGFQQGEPRGRSVSFLLYSDEGSIEFIFGQKDYKNPAGISQSEINRIMQSLRRVSPVESTRATRGRVSSSPNNSW